MTEQFFPSIMGQPVSELKDRSKENKVATKDFNAFPLLEDELFENAARTENGSKKLVNYDTSNTPTYWKKEVVWTNVFALTTVHALALWGWCSLGNVKVQTFYFLMGTFYLTSMALQAGVHRLWAHRSYKATLSLRIFLSVCYLLAWQNDIYQWVRDHRAHHKFAETDGDPHDIRRGFFFSHVGWIMVRKHPEVIRKGAALDMSDLKADPVVMFQRKYYIPMVITVWGVIPALIPVYFWNENLFLSICVCVFLRYAYSLNTTWLTNSWSHKWGIRPYDHRLAATESTIRHFLLGEGFHNYHHAFPWDYRTSELDAKEVFNPMAATINLFKWAGLAYDLKKASPLVVESKMKAKAFERVDYRKHSGVYEWIVGLTVVLSPLFVPRLLFCALNEHASSAFW